MVQKGMSPYALFVRKGARGFSLSSFLNNDTMKPLVPEDQSRSLAKTVLSRL
jgi:hypothetical protein